MGYERLSSFEVRPSGLAPQDDVRCHCTTQPIASGPHTGQNSRQSATP